MKSNRGTRRDGGEATGMESVITQETKLAKPAESVSV